MSPPGRSSSRRSTRCLGSAATGPQHFRTRLSSHPRHRPRAWADCLADELRRRSPLSASRPEDRLRGDRRVGNGTDRRPASDERPQRSAGTNGPVAGCLSPAASLPAGGYLGILLILLALAAIFAPIVAPYDYTAQDYSALTQPPSNAHWLGTDDLGRDILSRLIYGARISSPSGSSCRGSSSSSASPPG